MGVTIRVEFPGPPPPVVIGETFPRTIDSSTSMAVTHVPQMNDKDYTEVRAEKMPWTVHDLVHFRRPGIRITLRDFAKVPYSAENEYAYTESKPLTTVVSNTTLEKALKTGVSEFTRLHIQGFIVEIILNGPAIVV